MLGEAKVRQSSVRLPAWRRGQARSALPPQALSWRCLSPPSSVRCYASHSLFRTASRFALPDVTEGRAIQVWSKTSIESSLQVKLTVMR